LRGSPTSRKTRWGSPTLHLIYSPFTFPAITFISSSSTCHFSTLSDTLYCINLFFQDGLHRRSHYFIKVNQVHNMVPHHLLHSPKSYHGTDFFLQSHCHIFLDHTFTRFFLKSKERPNQSERKNQSECGEVGKVVYFVEVFLIVSLMFHENVKKIYCGQKIVLR
jgi:hypothetical protein